jgi:hypothetical protein
MGVFCIFSGVAHAQEATLSGTVTDVTGGVLPGVTITATHEASGNIFTALTDEAGIYRIALRTGVYKITCELAGFKTLDHSGVELLVGQQVVVNLQMQAASISESVTVMAEAPLVNTTSSTLGGNINARQVSELPVNGRNWLDLTMLAPGSHSNAVAETPTERNANNFGDFQLIVDGQQVTQTQALDFGQPRLSKDAIAEFAYVANRFDATKGRSSGIMVNAVTKSGSNVFQGSVSGFFRNQNVDAADFVTHTVLPYSDQQLSTTFGGPIVKDKVHFFANYEYERQPQTFVYNSSFPAFNVNLNSVNRPDTGGAKVDVQLSGKTHLSVRGNRYNNHIPIEPTTAGGANQAPSSAEERSKYANQIFASLIQVLSNRMLNTISGGFANFGWFRNGLVQTPGYSVNTPKGPGGGAERIQLTGYAIGASNVNLPANLEPHSYSIRDDLTYSFNKKGHHDLKVGGEYIYAPDHIFIYFNGVGTLDAQGGPIPANIQSLFPVWNDPSTWNLAALTPIARQYTRGVGNPEHTTIRNSSGYWLQDDWAMGRLTLNLGVRYDLQLGALAEGNTIQPFLPTPRPHEWDEVAPRVGFAYSLNDSTVFRGGWGKFYGEISDNLASFTPIQIAIINATVTPDGRPNWAANPFNGPAPTFEQAQATLCTVSNSPTCLRRSISSLPAPNLQVPYSYQFTAGVQRKLSDTMSLTADYAYIASRREFYSQNINLSYNPATGANYPFTNIALRPYPAWGTVSMTFSGGWSNSHSFQTGFTKRFSQHWQASGTYTLSEIRDGLPNPYSGLTQVRFPVAPDLGYQYGLAVTDQRHRAVANAVWEPGFRFQISGLYFFGSGERFPTYWGGDIRNSGGSNGRLEPNGTIVPRNNFVGSPVHRVDVRLQRRFKLGGRRSADALLETFNLFNHANYGSYSTQLSLPSYGQPTQNVNQAYLPRLLQLGFRVAF